MPLWYYDKKDLRNTPSLRDGIEPEVEARYRKEGARFIIDCGTKLGLRYDSCATGVVFFHRFYMFHSFKEFHRYVTAVCCLFLAGKTEETPKKCKDIIKTTKSMLNDAQFMVFGDNPKEEVMTMERILLQTIKFDLMVEHPYAYLLKFAKMIKSKSESADKGKVQKLVQMAWTFINDSLCTMLCLQWEPEVIAVSLMYLSSRLTKTDITEWQGKPAGFKGKWWEYLVEDINIELLEDVCHQVLDLYSTTPKKRDDTPPPPPPKAPHPSSSSGPAPQVASKRPRSPTPGELHRSHAQGIGPPQSKMPREDKRIPSPPSATKDRDRAHKKQVSRSSSGGSSKGTWSSTHPPPGPPPPGAPPAPPSTVPVPPSPVATTSTTFSQNNPYLSSQMYTSSFMTQEGSQSIQSLVGGRPAATTSSTYPPAPPYTQPPPTHTTQAPAASTSYTTQHTYPHSYQQGYQQQGYSQTQTSYTQPQGYTQPYTYPSGQYPASGSTYQQQPSSSYNQSYPRQQYPPAPQQYPQQYQGYNAPSYQNFAPTQSYQTPQTAQPPPPQPSSSKPHASSNSGSGLGIRITSRQ